jgi:hypothetical protein
LSEKLDGWRGFWDGQNFVTRRGSGLDPPHWFTVGIWMAKRNCLGDQKRTVWLRTDELICFGMGWWRGKLAENPRKAWPKEAWKKGQRKAYGYAKICRWKPKVGMSAALRRWLPPKERGGCFWPVWSSSAVSWA